MEKDILLIGAGKMGQAIANSLKKIYSPQAMKVLIKQEKNVQPLIAKLHCQVSHQVNALAPLPESVILAVKPQGYRDFCRSFLPYASQVRYLVSVMAGIKVETMQQDFPQAKIARAMPNTPCMIGSGMTVLFAKDWEPPEKQSLLKVFAALGQTIEVVSEDFIDASVAISGSGPGFLFYFAEIFKDHALELGFSAEQADELTRQTFFGVGRMLQQFPEKTITQLKEEVTSPGGSTLAGLTEFSAKHLPSVMKSGMQKAVNRAIELGQ